MPTTGRVRTRALAPWWVSLCLLAFVQSPGKTVADTKHDLTEDPTGFLSGALNMWSENMTLGQLQNQAYGYLFPQGPFFAAFDLLPDALAPDWVAQALWWSLTLCLAFTGAYRIAETARVGSHTSRVIAALLYALSPRIITTLGAISSEAWPVALAPWIALPLLRVAGDRSSLPRRAATRAATRAVLLSGLAVLCTGAVNAISTAAACIPAGLILLFFGFTGPRRARAWSMLGGWLAACAMVSMWWIVPLLLLGRYSAPFTDYIESSGVTTRWMSLGEALRGTTSWTPFVSFERIGGNALVAEPILIYATLSVTALGLLGLAMRGLPLRRMWLTMALIGIVIMAAWTEPFGLLWQPAREALDSALAAVRNLHKFDTVLRLPLIIGIAHATAQLPWPWERKSAEADVGVGTSASEKWLHPEKHPAAIAAMGVLLVLVGATAPAWSARLAPAGPFEKVPGYWHEAADWINAHGSGTRTLLLPSSPFADQNWGNTRDEPIQPLADVPWAVRDAIPLVPPEAIRGLDGLRDSLTRGREVPALDATLRNNGIGYVLVRRDLRLGYRADSLQDIGDTLRASKGMEKVAQFADDKGRTAIEIWGAGPALVRDKAMSPRLIDTTQIPLVAGGPEVLPRLDEVDRDAPVRILAGADAGTVTDTPARRGRNYGEVVRAESGILAADEETNVRNLVPDYPVAGIPLVQTATGRSEIAVSSSSSEPYNVGGAASQHSINAMLDGDKSTWWEPLSGKSQAEWVELTLPDRTDGAVITLTGAKVPAQVRVQTDDASVSTQLIPGQPTRIPLPGSATKKVKVTATIAPIGFGIAELKLVVPGAGAGAGADADAGAGADADAGTDSADLDLTPVRLPVVPDSSPLAQRWVFGQEVREGTFVRLFTVPANRRVRVDADTCRNGIGDPWATLERADGSGHRDLACGETLDLPAGAWRIDAKSDWVSLTDESYFAPTSEQQQVTQVSPALDQPIEASSNDRVLWLPSSVNRGREFRVGGAPMSPVTVNGWQQGWIIPAGVHGMPELTYPPQKLWKGGIIAGGALAVAYALIAGILIFAFRRHHPTGPIPPDALSTDLPRAVVAVTATVTVVLVSSWPGLLVGFGVVAIALAAERAMRGRVGVGKRERALRYGLISSLAAAMGAGAVLLATNPWPKEDYAGEGWPLQLLMTAALAATACYSVAFGRSDSES